MFQFANPQYLYLLLVIPLLVGGYCWSRLQQAKREARYGDRRLLHSLVPERSVSRPIVKFALFCCIVALGIVMIARPQFGQSTGTETRKGIEAVIVLDVSRSMLAEDVRPNRIERSKLLISTLVDRMKDDKIGLAIFAGEAYPQLPITNDFVSAKLFLDNITTDMVSLQGTNLAAAIELANNSFTQEKGVGKAIIVITDGENHEGGAVEAAQTAAKKGRRVYMLGVGTKDGATIPTENGPLLDNDGNVVRTSLNVEMCKEIAAAGNGCYIHVDDSNIAQDQLQDQLAKLQHSDSTVTSEGAMDEQFQAVGIILLIMMLIEMLLFDKQNIFYSRFNFFTKK